MRGLLCLTVSVIALVLFIGAIAALPGTAADRSSPASSQTWQSESGAITIDAKAGGVWISKPGRNDCVAVYFNENEGPVVGVYGKDTKALAAALSVHSNQGQLQLRTQGGKFVHLDGDTLQRLLDKIK